MFLIDLYNLKTKSKESCTELLKDFFSFRGEIKGFCFYGVNEKILFDFSDLRITESFISEYGFFWECTFNESTYFKSSSFSSLNPRNGVRTLASRKNFELNSCKIDKTIDKILSKKDSEVISRNSKLSDDLSHFLKIFYSEGRMKPQKESLLKGRYQGTNSYSDLTKLLKKHLFIEEHRSYKSKKIKNELVIGKKYQADAIKFCLEGTMSPKIKQIITE